MSKKIKVGYMIDTCILETFKYKTDQTGILATKFIEICMREYVDGNLKILDGSIYIEPVHVSRETQDVPKQKKTILKDQSPHIRKTDPVSDELAANLRRAAFIDGQRRQAYLHPGSVPNDERHILSYHHPVQPEERDNTPGITMESIDLHGVSFKEYFRKYWIIFYKDYNDAENWFDLHLPVYVSCITNKFIEDNKLNLRYRSELWGDIVVQDGILAQEHINEL